MAALNHLWLGRAFYGAPLSQTPQPTEAYHEAFSSQLVLPISGLHIPRPACLTLHLLILHKRNRSQHRILRELCVHFGEDKKETLA